MLKRGLRGRLGEYRPAPSLPKARPGPKPGKFPAPEHPELAARADRAPVPPGPSPLGPEPWKDPCFWSCPHYQARRILRYKPSGTLIVHGTGYNNIDKAIVEVGPSEVFFFEHLGLGWSAGASTWVAFRIVLDKGVMDDFAEIAFLVGGLNPADYYPIRRVIKGPAKVEILAANVHAANDFTTFALISGWIVPKTVR